VWNLGTGRLVAAVQTTHGAVTDLVFCPDGQRLAALNADSSITLWDFAAITRGSAAR
jgi:WD40 repeat protein